MNISTLLLSSSHLQTHITVDILHWHSLTYTHQNLPHVPPCDNITSMPMSFWYCITDHCSDIFSLACSLQMASTFPLLTCENLICLDILPWHTHQNLPYVPPHDNITSMLMSFRYCITDHILFSMFSADDIFLPSPHLWKSYLSRHATLTYTSNLPYVTQCDNITYFVILIIA